MSQAREAGFAVGGARIIFTIAEFLFEGSLIHVCPLRQSVRPGCGFFRIQTSLGIGEMGEYSRWRESEGEEEEHPDGEVGRLTSAPFIERETVACWVYGLLGWRFPNIIYFFC